MNNSLPDNAKYVFELIRKAEKCSYSELLKSNLTLSEELLNKTLASLIDMGAINVEWCEIPIGRSFKHAWVIKYSINKQ